ncbi:MAG: hypothetical protein IKK75_08595 [Clostridia bacterium]|nr:hypothetical protein [Clostridia bacterium]
MILQPKKVQALKKQFFEAFFFAHRAKNLAISGFFVNKTTILSAKTVFKTRKVRGVRDGETNKMFTPNTNNDFAPAQKLSQSNPLVPVWSNLIDPEP